MTQAEFLAATSSELDTLTENGNNAIATAAQAHVTWRTVTFQNWLDDMQDCLTAGFGPGSNPQTPPPPPPGT